MGSPATAAFHSAWRRSGRQAVTLFKVELTDPSTRTLYLATAGITTPDGQTWEAAVADGAPIRQRGVLCVGSVALASSGFTLLDRQLAYQSGTGRRIAEVFKDYRWKGATVTQYFWERSLTSFADALQRYKGQVFDYHFEDDDQVVVELLQRRDYNRELTPMRVDKDRFPKAPDQALGAIPATVYGALRAAPSRLNVAYDATEHRLERMRGSSRLVRSVLVDTGGGATTKTRVLLASHPCKTFMDAAKGCVPWIEIEGYLAFIDVAGGDVFNGADGTGFDIGSVSGGTDPFNICHLALYPVQIELDASNNAGNPRYALDPWNETDFALLDYNANKRKITARLPSLGAPGDFVSVRAMVLYYTPTGPATTNLRLRFRNTVGSHQTDTTMPLAGGGVSFVESAAITSAFGSGAAGMPSVPWGFGECVVEVDFSAAPASNVVAQIYGFALSIRLRPNRAILSQSPARYVPRGRVRGNMPIDPTKPFLGIPPEYLWALSPAIATFAAVDAPIFANLEGWADDGSGTYTDVAGALIERAPDIAAHALVTYGLEDINRIERGASAFGSFKVARAGLKTWRNTDMIHGVAINDPNIDMIRFLELLGGEGSCWFHISPFDDKWHCIPWKAGAAVDYDLLLAKHHLAGAPRLSRTPETAIVTAVKVPYGFDQRTGAPSHEVFAAPGRSSSGHLYHGLRDEQMEVIPSGAGQNNKLDVNRSGLGDFTATLTTGVYTPAELRAEVQAALEAADSTPHWVVLYGGLVVAGVNDKFSFTDDVFFPEKYTVTLDPGTYTMEELAAQLQTKMNAVITGFTVTYSRATRVFTIVRSSNWNHNPNDAGNTASNWTANCLFGFSTQNSGTILTLPGNFEREERRFVIGAAAFNAHAFNLEWESGPNGLTAGLKNCSSLLGFDTLNDRNFFSGISGSHAADSPKADRETLLKAARDMHGGKRDFGVEGMTIYDTPTGVELRNRLIDLLAPDRPKVVFTSEYVPDLECGRVVGCEASVDDLRKYGVEGSDGSWAGKRFLVLEIVQQGGGVSYETEFVGVEISAP